MSNIKQENNKLGLIGRITLTIVGCYVGFTLFIISLAIHNLNLLIKFISNDNCCYILTYGFFYIFIFTIIMSLLNEFFKGEKT